nr:putative reverse transcriptase domain-containing protein [Tanacetum cinerariifolium]
MSQWIPKTLLGEKDLLHDQHGGFTLPLLDSLFSKGLRTVKSIHPKCRLGFSQVLKKWVSLMQFDLGGMPGGSKQLLRETLAESSPTLSDVDDEKLDLDGRNIKQYRIKSISCGTSCGRDGLRAQGFLKCVVVSDELTSSITQVLGGGIRPIALSTVWRRLGSKVSTIMIGHSLDGYLDGLPFSVGLSGGSEAILHAVNCLIESCGDDVGLSMLLVDFKNAFNLVDREVRYTLLCVHALLVSLSLPNVLFNVALRSSLEHVVSASRPGYDNWQWMLATLPFAFGGLGVYYAGDVLNYAFLASRFKSAGLQTKLFRHTGIVASRLIFDDVLCVFNTLMETDLLSNLSEIDAPKLIKKMANIYFARFTKIA